MTILVRFSRHSNAFVYPSEEGKVERSKKEKLIVDELFKTL